MSGENEAPVSPQKGTPSSQTFLQSLHLRFGVPPSQRNLDSDFAAVESAAAQVCFQSMHAHDQPGLGCQMTSADIGMDSVRRLRWTFVHKHVRPSVAIGLGLSRPQEKSHDSVARHATSAIFMTQTRSRCHFLLIRCTATYHPITVNLLLADPGLEAGP